MRRASMSIRLQLNLALGALLVATIAAMITALLLDAQHRVQNEVVSSMRATETLLRSSLSSLEGATDVRARVGSLVASLQNLRHVEITLANSRSAVVVPADGRRTPRSGFAYIGEPIAETAVVPVVVSGRKVDEIIITAEAGDELSEVWETIGRVSFYALALAAGGFALTSLLINSALSPVHDLGRALHLLEEGDYNVEVPTGGPPEISVIGTEVNALAAALQKARDENRRLSTAIIQAQDEERQDVARELHDEIGPHLFSIRASGVALSRALAQTPPDSGKAIAYARDVQQNVDALQATNRRVLQQLSPVGLDELGLSGALTGMITMWRNQQPYCDATLSTSGALDRLDRTIALTVYRMVQEGLTNAYRHAGASAIGIIVHYLESDVRIAIRDDGIGLPEEAQYGLGLRGMRERISALGGRLAISAPPEGGTLLEAFLPTAVAFRSGAA